MISLAIALALATADLYVVWNVLLKTLGDPLQTSARAMGSSALVVAPLAVGAWLVAGRPALPPRALLLAGLMTIAYLLVLAALSIASLAMVAPLRESAIVLVTLWSVWRLRERQRLWPRVGGACAILLGACTLAIRGG